MFVLGLLAEVGGVSVQQCLRLDRLVLLAEADVAVGVQSAHVFGEQVDRDGAGRAVRRVRLPVGGEGGHGLLRRVQIIVRRLKVLPVGEISENVSLSVMHALHYVGVATFE